MWVSTDLRALCWQPLVTKSHLHVLVVAKFVLATLSCMLPPTGTGTGQALRAAKDKSSVPGSGGAKQQREQGTFVAGVPGVMLPLSSVGWYKFCGISKLEA